MEGRRDRILVVGPTGSGKTSTSKHISRILELPHVELDKLRYGPGWEPVPDAEFVRAVGEEADRARWVIDGNYAAVRNLLWDRADLVLWLDLPLRVIVWRLLRRTAHRLLSDEDLGNGNREQFSRVLGRRSILLWAIRSHGPLRAEYERKAAAVRMGTPQVVRLRTTTDERAWLDALHPARTS